VLLQGLRRWFLTYQAPPIPDLVSDIDYLIKRNQGIRLFSYQDPLGIWTIGFGHTGPDVYPDMRITREQADKLFEYDLFAIQSMTWSQIHDIPTTPHQYSAMVSLVHNIGITAFRRSSVLKHHRNHQYEAAANAFLLFIHERIDDKLVISDELLKRRKEERSIYLDI
jgi:lysozyme